MEWEEFTELVRNYNKNKIDGARNSINFDTVSLRDLDMILTVEEITPQSVMEGKDFFKKVIDKCDELNFEKSKMPMRTCIRLEYLKLTYKTVEK